MATTASIRSIRSILTRMGSAAGRPERLGYTEKAFTDNEIEGTERYDVTREQNIPLAGLTEYNETVINKGIQAQGASIPREAYNHFLGRFSFNLRKLNEQMGLFIDTFLKYAAENAGLYDAALEYPINAVCYVITAGTGGVPVYTWYRRTGGNPDETISNVPVSNSNYWTRMSEATMLAQPVRQGTNLDTLFAEGVYFTENSTVGRTITGLPPAVAALAQPLFLLTVSGNGDIRTQTLVVGTPGSAGNEYTRVLNQQGVVVQDWYLSKSPGGLQITAVPEGVFAFRVEDVTETDPETGTTVIRDRGHLMLYWNSPEELAAEDRPAISIVTDRQDPLYGHLVWEYGDE